MSNKTDLQAYNNALSGIIDKVNALPRANVWDSETTIIPGSETIIVPAYSNKEIVVEPIKEYLDRIEITTMPTKLEYKKDKDGLDLTGMVVTCFYKDGSNRVVTNYTTDPAAGSVFSTEGTHNITVLYTEDDETKAAYFSVEVTSLKIVTWAGGTDAEIVEMVAAADRGEINLSDYWSVGQERKVNLSAMAATGVGESHVAQTVTFVLMNAGGKELANGKQCSFIVGMKNCLADGINAENGYMNPTSDNNGGWDACARRTWCNSTFRNAIPAALRPIFKQHKNITEKYSAAFTSIDWFALPAEKEIGNTSNANYNIESNLIQFEYYKTGSNSLKHVGDNGFATVYWERSPYDGSTMGFAIMIAIEMMVMPIGYYHYPHSDVFKKEVINYE